MIVAPAIHEKEWEVAQRDTTYQVSGATNYLANLGIFRDARHNILNVLPESVAETGDFASY